MLSYRHAFHAGNHADVLKHLVLIQLLDYLVSKDKALWVIDTHAGAGAYALDGQHASKTGEYSGGVGRLWPGDAGLAADMPTAVRRYLEQVQRFNKGPRLTAYPGSPLLAHGLLRPEDRLRLFELHSTDIEILAAQFRAAGRQPGRPLQVIHDDGFEQLKALLPPPSRRALVLIDPSYEQKQDYGRLIAVLKDALARFATGCYVIWYPELSRLEARELPERLKKIAGPDWLQVTLSVRGPGGGHEGSGGGMAGSGLFIINPPWTLEATLRDTLPWLTRTLAEDDGARYTLTTAASAPSAPARRPPIVGGRRPGGERITGKGPATATAATTAPATSSAPKPRQPKRRNPT